MTEIALLGTTSYPYAKFKVIVTTKKQNKKNTMTHTHTHKIVFLRVDKKSVQYSNEKLDIPNDLFFP